MEQAIIIEQPQMVRFYDIISDLGNMIYTGSTEKTIKRRFSVHKCQYKLWQQGKTNHTGSFDLFEKYGIENCKIKEISSQICDKATRDAIESQRILLHRADITKVCKNQKLPGIWTDAEKKEYHKQRYIENIGKIKAHSKQYYEENVDAIKAQQKQYRDNNVDTIKQYRDNNVDTIKQYHKQYKIDNAIRMNQKHICDKCLGKFTTANKTTHEKSKKHQQSLQPTIYNITINLNK